VGIAAFAKLADRIQMIADARPNLVHNNALAKTPPFDRSPQCFDRSAEFVTQDLGLSLEADWAPLAIHVVVGASLEDMEISSTDANCIDSNPHLMIIRNGLRYLAGDQIARAAENERLQDAII